jgi:aspartyl-tRNA(Asn)/glutamyl-tRNA(Gln) amidotransferase subunit A
MTSSSLCSLSLAQAATAVRNASLSPAELTRACLQRIDGDDEIFNAFISLRREPALHEAEQRTAELRRPGGWRGPLHGIPVAVKDLLDVAGEVTTAASALFLQNTASRDAEVINRLKRAGAIILGKTNLHEFAYGGSGLISHFGPVRNPANPQYIAGGSSSGSAAAVAAGFCFAAIGTDTAGSIRLPAAYCGVVGLKPTYGAVSTDGVIPLSWSLDHVGPLTRTVEDAALVFRAISDVPTSHANEQKLRVGVARQYFFDNVDSEILDSINAAVTEISGAIDFVGDVTIPVEEDRTVSNAEAFAYHRQFVAEHPEQYQPETLRRIRSAEQITAAAYIQKRRELEQLRKRVSEIFRDVDVLVTPTVPIPQSLIEELQANPSDLRPRELLMLRNTRPFNVLGLTALSVPCGRTATGLPVGMQLIAATGREDDLFRLGTLIENRR